jgi:hypothetical protein
MSFIPFIRDYIELLNTVYDSFSNDISIQKIIQETIVYLAQTIKFLLLYIVTFQWFRDIIYLPILIPQISTSIFKETFFIQTPLDNTFNILEIPTFTDNKFLIGFLNSFFLALPISCAHLIYVRRLLIQGNVAGMAAGLGNIFGQLFFIGSIILGFRFFLIPWFSFEPLTYILGVILLLTIIYDMVHERVIKIIDWNNRPTIFKIFFLNFILIWTEQSCIFQYLGNVTLSADSSLIESFSTNTFFSYLSTHLFYLVGLFFGSIFFNVVFAVFLKNFTEFLQIKLSILRSTWIIRLNVSLLTLILTFTFTSIPFYGLDYLFAQPLGFISQDKAFKNTIFSPNEITDPFGILGGFSENLSLDTDVTTFDRGLYLKSPIFQTFEDLNYSGEYAATIRQGNIPLFDQYKEKARKIREILVKKSESDNENNLSTKTSNTKGTTSNLVDYNSSTTKEKEKISFEYPTYYPIDKNIYISSNIQKRFENNYKEPSNVIFENVLQGSLNNVFSDEKFTVAYPEIDKKLKQKYYANPVYKFLLSTDIDNFLKRQPSEHVLSPKEENDLYKKRLILGRYNDSLRFYNKLPYTDEFQHFFNGSKSFADRVYNQQFKGTLHIVRRLFSISFDSETKNSQELIMKYDQPLFKKSKNLFEIPIYHEELNLSKNINSSQKIKDYSNSIDSLRIADSSQSADSSQPLNSTTFELVSQSPLYVGWDEDLREILVTNRLLSRSVANYHQPQSVYSSSLSEQSENLLKDEPFTERKGIQFSTWPISINKLEDKNSNLILNSRLLFETKNSLERQNYNNLIPLFEYEDKESGISYYESLPNNVIKLASGIVDVIPPNRGGFIWPGTSALKFSLKDVFKV